MANLSREQVKQIILKAPKGLPPAEIVRALYAQGHTIEGFNDQQRAAQAYPGSPSMSMAGRANASDAMDAAHAAIQFMSEPTKAAPFVGGMLGGIGGGMAGAPLGPVGVFGGAVAGAGIGGGLGRTLAGAAQGAVPSAGDIGHSAAEQAINEALGQALAGAARFGAKGLTTHSLGMSRELNREFPQTVETVLQDRGRVGKSRWLGLPMGIYPKQGSEVAGKALGAAIEPRNAALAVARAGGVSQTVKQISQPAIERATKFVQTAEGRGLTPQEERATIALVRNTIQERLGHQTHGVIPQAARVSFNPELTHLIKQVAGDEVDRLMAAQRAGTATAVNPSLMEDIRSGAKSALEATVPPYAGKDFSTLESDVQRRVGVNRAVKAAEGRKPPEHLVHSLIWMLARHGFPPELTSRLALLLTEPVTQTGLRQLPRTITAAQP